MNGKGLAKTALLILGLGLFGGGVFGQTVVTDIKVDVAFPFIVSNTTLPPGQYILHEIQPWVFEISTAKKDLKVVFLTEPGNREMPKAPGELIFNEYGDQYFLSRIWLQEPQADFYLPKSHYERSLMKGGIQKVKHLPIPAK